MITSTCLYLIYTNARQLARSAHAHKMIVVSTLALPPLFEFIIPVFLAKYIAVQLANRTTHQKYFQALRTPPHTHEHTHSLFDFDSRGLEDDGCDVGEWGGGVRLLALWHVNKTQNICSPFGALEFGCTVARPPVDDGRPAVIFFVFRIRISGILHYRHLHLAVYGKLSRFSAILLRFSHRTPPLCFLTFC